MATETKSKTYLCGTTYFRIKKWPGPFDLAGGWWKSLERYSHQDVIELTVYLAEKEGQELLGIDQALIRPFKVRFEIALRGTTSAYASVGPNDSPGVRLIGRFHGDIQLLSRLVELDDAKTLKTIKAIDIVNELTKWQWEVIFNPRDRWDEAIGVVNKLGTPLTDALTR